MVKGISRQVIVVRSPDPEMFEQAIFILRDGQRGVTDEALLKEANRLIGKQHGKLNTRIQAASLLWAMSGALITGVVWLLSSLM